ncbi:MAG: aldo/keto reductase [Cohaesibacteraceae bacterium]|nr:aldo/keto reductase [Cohaesibacteraceae bacterium]MBL4875778.1 aldo/keto reductase [Cohaesibacteraceae bacterium]
MNDLSRLETKVSKSDLVSMSSLVWGTWRCLKQFNDTQSFARFLHELQILGVTTLDTADIYGGHGAEAFLGQALREMGTAANVFQIVSKGGIRTASDRFTHIETGHYDSSPAYIRRSVERSLRELGRQTLDLFLIHRPDYLMDASETGDALDNLINDGLAKSVGVSNFSTSQFNLLQSGMTNRLVTNQIEYSPLETMALDDGRLDQMQFVKLRPMCWSPLGAGRLFEPKGKQAIRVRFALERLSDKYDLSGIDAAAIVWTLRHPSRPVPVIGTGRIDRIGNVLRAVSKTIEHEDWYRILVASRGKDMA